MPWGTVYCSALSAAGFRRVTGCLPPRLAGHCARAFRALTLAAAVVAGCLVPAGSHAAAVARWDDPEYVAATWETEEGLPENSATAMVQSPEGYLWFGTFNGLVRFDGVRFTVFDPVNTPQLPAAGIINLHLDRRGRLWVSTARGLVVREGTQWRPVRLDAGYVRGFAEQTDGRLLLTTSTGGVFEFAGDELTELPRPPGRPDAGYLGFAGEHGKWWVVQRWFVGAWNGRSWEAPAAITNLFHRIGGGGAARDGGLWLLAGTNLVKYREGRDLVRFQLPEWPGSAWSMSEDSRGNVWIATYDRGLSRVSPSGQVRRWTTTNGLSYNGTRFVFEDRERTLWVGTSGGGLQHLKPRRFHGYGFESGLTERNVTSVWPDGTNGLWIATYAQGMFHQLNGAIAKVALPPGGNTLELVNSVLMDRTGRTWFGTWGQGVCVLDARGFRGLPQLQVGGSNICAMFEDSRGRIWVGGERQVSVGENETFRSVGDSQGAALAGVRCFAEDRSGVIWASNLEGLYRGENGQFAKVREQGETLRDITCLKADADGTLWLGLERGGLLYRRGEQVTRLELGEDAVSPGVFGILEDAAGFFWMASNRGVLRAARHELVAAADARTKRVGCQVLGLSDGLPSLECPHGRQPICARDERGRFWFATKRGVAMIDPAGFHLNTNLPPVVIESVTFQRPVRDEAGAQEAGLRLEAPFPDPVLLPPGSRHLEIHYTAPSPAAARKVRFQFKLEGIDADWRNAGEQRSAQFYELAPDHYTFRVRAANNDGVWNESGASLAFTVQPFFWQTGWFRAVVAGLLVGLGGALAWGRYRRALVEVERTRRQQAELAHMSRVSIMGELSASMAHELNQPLTAILTNAQVAQRFMASGHPDLAEFREILKDIAHDTTRARDVISHLRSLVKKSEPDFINLDLSETIREVVGFLHGDIVSRNVRVTLDLPADLPLVHSDRIQLQQVVINLLFNAFDAMSGNPVTQRVASVTAVLESPESVRVTVRDRGPGIAADKLEAVFDPFYTTKREGMGMGLAVTRSIIEAHGGHIHAENAADGGAVFHFTLPVPDPT